MKQAGTLILAVTMTMVFPAWGGGDSSDGHTHAAPEPMVIKASAPRAAAVSEEFEAVVVLDGRKLVLYLDRFASNEPVAGATVEIEGAGLKGIAMESSPGIYAIDAAAITPAKHPLTISIEAGDSADLLSATLDVTPPLTGVVHSHGWSEWIVWLSAGVLTLVGGALLAIRRRKQSKGVK